jgi:hypothetical protein
MFSKIDKFNYSTVFYENIEELTDIINKKQQAAQKFIPDFDANKKRYLELLK